MTRTALFGAVTLFVVLASGCGANRHPVTSSGPGTTSTAALTHLTVFRLLNGVLHAEDVAVPATQAVAGASLQALGLSANVTIANGSAAVDLPNATDAQVAEVVWTLTQFPTVKRVDLPGHKGLTRVDEVAYVAPIMIEAPLPPNPVPHTFHVIGTARVFEGTLVIELQVNGTTVVRKTVTATAGAPDLGTFDTVVHTTANGAATLLAYSPSAVDGSPQHEVRENLQLGR